MKRFLLLILAATTLFIGCSESRHYVVETDLRQINTEFFSSSYSVTVTSEYAWEATPLNEWITLTKYSGSAGVSKLDIHVTQNPDLEERRGTIEIYADGSKETKVLTIVQKGNDFIFEVSNLSATSADLKITAKSELRTFYYYNVTDENFSAYYERNTKFMMESIRNMLQQYISMGAFPSWASVISTGSAEMKANGLKPDTEYIFFAFGVDSNGNLTSKDISYVWYKTLPKE